jgi:phosphoribosyl 1,2-cyclic phosphodiesterase
VDVGSTRLLIDCGFSIKETERRLERLGAQPRDLNAILVTHEHADHIRGVIPLARKYGLTVYMTAGTHRALSFALSSCIDLKLIDSHSDFVIGDLAVTPVAVPHDAREPVQYVIRSSDNLSLGVLTDLGSITAHVIQHFDSCHGLFLECNHDSTLLANGSYPLSLKRRIAGDWGHLNNQQSLDLLQNIQTCQLQQLVLGHISEQNNSLAAVQAVMSNLRPGQFSVHYACQNDGVGWLELSRL